MSQSQTVQLAKDGKPQAIADLINGSLEPRGMSVKATFNNGCLVLQVEAQAPPEQQNTVSFIRNGLGKLRPQSVSRVIVRGRVVGQSTVVWQESFSLPSSDSIVSASQVAVEVNPAAIQRVPQHYKPVPISKTEVDALGTVTVKLTTRNLERLGLVLGTAVLTSACWLGFGALTHATRTPPSDSASSPVPVASTAPDEPSAHTIKGTFRLVDSDLGGTTSNCYGSGGYSDVEGGMPVTVRDGQGKIIATAKVSDGVHPADEKYANVVCEFAFQVDNVPKTDFYAIEVGHRGTLNYSFAEIQQKGWTVSLSLK
ncbi:hypothetical protein [Phormidesmis priestleyi]|uniref:hypothetical protein n=1 Tax=Phormidesmis priestleyi TaxID=268141 RepID=UPI00083B58A0|nr:hypothetical protein [Phormidesmis priestleyi]